MSEELGRAARVRISAILQAAEAGFLSENSRLLMQALDRSAVDDPVFSAVRDWMEELQGVRLRSMRISDFRDAAESSLDDAMFLFLVPLAAMAVDQLSGHHTYQVRITGDQLRTKVNAVLEQEESLWRVSDNGVLPLEDEPSPTLSEKFGILRSPNDLATDFERWQGEGDGIGLLFLDIDGFKRLNTAYTNVVVDRHVLRPFQERIRSAVQGRGAAYAEGGDEIIVLLRNVSPEEVKVFGERLLEAARDMEFQVDGRIERVTISVGAAAAGQGESMESLRERANKAEGKAKSSGKNRLVME